MIYGKPQVQYFEVPQAKKPSHAVRAAKPTAAEQSSKRLQRLTDARSSSASASVGTDLASQKPWASFGEQLLAVREYAKTQGVKSDPRLYAASGLNESSDSAGGFQVAPEYSSRILQQSFQEGLIVSRCDTMPMNSSQLRLPSLVDTSRSDGRRYGGVQVYRTPEASPVIPTVTMVKGLELNANKLMAMTYFAEELEEDITPAVLEAFSMATVPKAMAWQLDDESFNGTGVSQFLGALKSNAVITVAKDVAQPVITALDIENMYMRLWGPSRPTAAWFINQAVEPQLMPLTRTAGSSVEPLYDFDGDAGEYPTMLGLPVIPVEHCAPLGTVGDIVLADMNEYIIGMRLGPISTRSIHVEFLTGQNAFRYVMRNDGTPKWPAPLQPRNMTTTLSPFVMLGSRS